MAEETKLINFRLPVSEIKRLEATAKRLKQNKSELSRDLISRGLDRLAVAEQKSR